MSEEQHPDLYSLTLEQSESRQNLVNGVGDLSQQKEVSNSIVGDFVVEPLPVKSSGLRKSFGDNEDRTRYADYAKGEADKEEGKEGKEEGQEEGKEEGKTEVGMLCSVECLIILKILVAKKSQWQCQHAACQGSGLVSFCPFKATCA